VADYTSDFSPVDADNGAWQLLFLAPTIIANNLSGDTQTGITLGAIVNPQGSPTAYHWDYGTTTNYGLTAPVPDGSAGSGTGQVTVSQAITDLQPNTDYYYQFTATNEGGTTNSSGLGFPTLPPRPTVTTELSTNPGQTDATLNGEVNPYGAGPWGLDEARYYFQYGLTTSYGSQIPNPYAVLSQPGPQNVSQGVSGLQPRTTYHTRLVAKNVGGTSFGNDVIFSTEPAVTVTGFSEVVVYNRSDYNSLNIWAFDQANGTYQELTGSPVDNVSDSSSASLDLTNQHSYLLLGIYQGAEGCDGNDPQNSDCIVWNYPPSGSILLGSADGPTETVVIT
jgi:hypothetical protein